MSAPRFLTSLQKHTGTTRSEAITVLAIACVIAAGTIGPWIFSTPPLHEVATAHKIIAMLDSMALDSRSRDSTLAMSGAADYSTGANEKLGDAESHYSRRSPRAGSTAASSVPRGRRININTASMAQLERLPGVGPATAEAIIKRRTMRKFMDVDDLMDIRGIGTKKLEKMRPYIECAPPPEKKPR